MKNLLVKDTLHPLSPRLWWFPLYVIPSKNAVKISQCDFGTFLSCHHMVMLEPSYQ